MKEPGRWFAQPAIN